MQSGFADNIGVSRGELQLVPVLNRTGTQTVSVFKPYRFHSSYRTVSTLTGIKENGSQTIPVLNLYRFPFFITVPVSEPYRFSNLNGPKLTGSYRCLPVTIHDLVLIRTGLQRFDGL